MTHTDIVRLQLRWAYPTFMQDVEAATRLENANQLRQAGERCKLMAKRLLEVKQNTFAIDYYTKASELFRRCQRYEKAINAELMVYEIHKMSNNVYGMATTYEKVASFYRYFLENNSKAASYYLMSAKLHEQNQNYLSAFSKAKFASKCLDQVQNRKMKRDANSLAFRMALQSGYHERAGIYARKWLNIVPRDYSSHYIAICNKGYKAFALTSRFDDALFFINEILIAHFDQGVRQEKIGKYLIEAQKLFIRVNGDFSRDYNMKIIAEFEQNTTLKINYSLELKNFAQGIGLDEISDSFYVQEKYFIQQRYKGSKEYIRFAGYCIWKFTSDYGLSLKRWFLTTTGIVIFFGLLYGKYSWLISVFPSLNWFWDIIKPNLKVTGVDSWFTPFYYSIVTFTTLGFGDVTPGNTSGQIFSSLEVLTGYLALGGLLTVFAKKLMR